MDEHLECFACKVPEGPRASCLMRQAHRPEGPEFLHRHSGFAAMVRECADCHTLIVDVDAPADVVDELEARVMDGNR